MLAAVVGSPLLATTSACVGGVLWEVGRSGAEWGRMSRFVYRQNRQLDGERALDQGGFKHAEALLGTLNIRVAHRLNDR